MELYEQKSRWKIYLGIAALILILISGLYSNYLANKLKEGERKKAETFALAMKNLIPKIKVNVDGQSNVDLGSEDEVALEQEIVFNTKLPVIAVNETGQISESKNFAEGADLEKELAKIKRSGIPPIEGFGYAKYIYYKQSRLLTLLQYFPLIQLLLLLGFIGIGYLAFSNARKSEQNRVWVGMAKETAHQLGTPISAIIAWLEHLKISKGDDAQTMEIVHELENDVDRLNLIADRFSKIGSEPKLDIININEELEKCRSYMQKRASRKVVFDFPGEETPIFQAKVNPPLFAWVVENLLRNALDAMDGTGEISAQIYEEGPYISIDISDTGKGIPAKDLKTVFQPGFTTKKRGWGLGLSLAKRIIESYHLGKIFVKKSILNEGTTFAIKLPKS